MNPEDDLSNTIDERWFRISESIVAHTKGIFVKRIVGERFLFESCDENVFGQVVWKLRRERSGLKDNWKIAECFLEPA